MWWQGRQWCTSLGPSKVWHQSSHPSWRARDGRSQKILTPTALARDVIQKQISTSSISPRKHHHPQTKRWFTSLHKTTPKISNYHCLALVVTVLPPIIYHTCIRNGWRKRRLCCSKEEARYQEGHGKETSCQEIIIQNRTTKDTPTNSK